jgi:hypothetical protein
MNEYKWLVLGLDAYHARKSPSWKYKRLVVAIDDDVQDYSLVYLLIFTYPLFSWLINE